VSKLIILASSSPRRLELLKQIGVSCEVMSADIDETPMVSESAQSLVERLARAKAMAVAMHYPEKSHDKLAPVLAADTVVYLPGAQGRIFGKPKDKAHALEMLATLSNRTHQVATGVAFFHGGVLRSQVVVTQVTFAPISSAVAKCYWHSGEPAGKAGAYAIQGAGARFVTSITGSYSNVVGLPLHETSVWLEQAGIFDDEP